MPRLVVVSNRVASVTGRQVTAAGGLAVGVHAALQRTGGLWFGWSGNVVQSPPDEARLMRRGRISYGVFDLAERDFQAYYAGFSNRTLWPLFHYRIDLASYDREWYEGYRRVNRLFADLLQPHLRDDDLIWIHDYHLIPLGAELRRLGVRTRIGFFLHIPFPSPEVFITLPWHRQLVRDLCACDVVGFQTETDCRQFASYLKQELGGQVSRDGRVQLDGRKLRLVALPIGIDVDEFRQMAESEEAQSNGARLAATLSGRHLVIGVDRLDYSKGLPERLAGFELLLREYPEHRQRVTFLQISAPSRENVPEYRELRRQVELLAGRINGAYGEPDWVPLRYIRRSYSRRALAGFFRVSRIGLVTPLRDGMNLVAMEYVAAQDSGNPGVLVLSRFAGCAAHLRGALVVNPYDHFEVAAALHAGLTMPLDQRLARWHEAWESIRDSDVRSWRDQFLAYLADTTSDELTADTPSTEHTAWANGAEGQG